MKVFGTDIRNGLTVEIIEEKKEAHKKTIGLVVSKIENERDWCTPVHVQGIPSSGSHSAFLCKYPDGSITWVDGKHIQIIRPG